MTTKLWAFIVFTCAPLSAFAYAAGSLPAGLEDGAYQPGTPQVFFAAERSAIMIDGARIDKVDDALLLGYAALARDTKALDSISKVIETQEKRLELYSDDALLLAYDIGAGAPALIYHRDDFNADAVTYVKQEPTPELPLVVPGELGFTLRECIAGADQAQRCKTADLKLNLQGLAIGNGL